MDQQPVMRVLEPRQWATPEEVQSTIDALLEDSKKYRWVSIAVVAEDAGGKVYTRSSRVENKYAVAASYFMMAMKLMGFKEEGDRPIA